MSVQPGVIGLSDSLGVDSGKLSGLLTLLEWNPSRHSSIFDHITDLQSSLDTLTEYAVKSARADNKTWAEIGHWLGISKQAAHKRFGHLDR